MLTDNVSIPVFSVQVWVRNLQQVYDNLYYEASDPGAVIHEILPLLASTLDWMKYKLEWCQVCNATEKNREALR